ncbi:hypothetical protein ACFLQK_02840, partial [bacterium]
VFSFSSLPLCLCLAAFMLVFFGGPLIFPGVVVFSYAFLTFISFGMTGLVNEFGIDPIPATLWSFVIICSSAGVASSILLTLHSVFGFSLIQILKNMM